MTLASLDAITLDAYGTLVELVDPLPALQRLLPEFDRGAIRHAFQTEVAYYRAHASDGRDTATMRALREDCVGVFNDSLGSTLTADAYVGALEFRVLSGVVEALDCLRARGLELAVVGNWDLSLHERLDVIGLRRYFAAVVAAAAKPAPDGIVDALTHLGVAPERALHVGDDDADAEAAEAAGVRFAPAPLREAVASLA